MLFFLLFFVAVENAQVEWTLDTETLSEPISNVEKVIMSQSGQLFLYDFEGTQIFIISPEGIEIGRFGRKGQGPGEWQWGWHFMYSPQQNTLFLFDQGKSAWINFQTDGILVKEDRVLGSDVQCFLSEGTTLHLEKKNPFENPELGCVIYVTRGGTRTDLARFDAKMHADPYMLNKEGMQLQLGLGNKNQAFLELSPKGDFLAVGSTGALDIKIYETENFVLKHTISEKLPFYPISDTEIKERLEALKININGTVMKLKPGDIDFPDYSPPIESVLIDRENRLWVHLSSPHKAKQATYAVYQLNGQKLGSLKTTSTFNLITADKHFIWGFDSDPSEETILLTKKHYQLHLK